MTSWFSVLSKTNKGPNSKPVLSQSNGIADKMSPPKGPLVKSLTPVKLTTTTKLSPMKNGAEVVSKNNTNAVKKMDASPPKATVKSTSPPNKNAKTSPSKPHPPLERSNSHGDAGNNIQSVKSQSPGQVAAPLHSNGSCDVVGSTAPKLKENHFAPESCTESAGDKAEAALNGECKPSSISETAADETTSGCPNGNVLSQSTTQDVAASGDKLSQLTTDMPQLKETLVAEAVAAESKSVGEETEPAVSKAEESDTGEVSSNKSASPLTTNVSAAKPSDEESLPAAVAGANSPVSSIVTDCNQCPVETEKQVEPEVTKHTLRLKLWEHLEKNDLVVFPRPCNGRIPNFKGAPTAAEKLTTLDIFKKSKTVKVNPDKPQEMVRFKTLEYGKRLLVSVPRLREGLFQAVVPPTDSLKYHLQTASQRYGMKKWGRPLSPDDKVSIDLVVLGSVLVDKQGRRISKGDGFSDLEFAMLMKMNAINEKTIIVTTVHDDQVYDHLPEELFKEHDVPVDWIITPTQVIEVANKLPRPDTIIWNILSNRRILEIPMLQKLREEELSEGQECTLKEVDSDVEEKPYIQRFTRRRRFDYSRSTGDPIRDNKMHAPQGQYFNNRPRQYYQPPPPPPPSNRPNNYAPVMRNNAPLPRRAFYPETVELKQQMGRPIMREPRSPNMNHNNRPTNRSHIMAHPGNENRSRSMNRMQGPRNRSNARSGNRQHSNSLPIKGMTKSVEVQTVEESPRKLRSSLKRKRAPIEFSLRVKNIGVGVRVRDLKVALNERGVKPRDITWRGYKGSAFLHFVKPPATQTQALNVEEVIKTLQDLPLPPKDKKSLVIEPIQSKKSDVSTSSVENGSEVQNDDAIIIKSSLTEPPDEIKRDDSLIVHTIVEAPNVVERDQVLIVPTVTVDQSIISTEK